MTIIVALFLSRHALEREWLLPRSSVRYPSAGVKTHGAESELWGEELLNYCLTTCSDFGGCISCA